MTCDRIIANASPLIFLSKAEGLDWLACLSQDPVLIPQAVVREIEAGYCGMDLIAELQNHSNFSIVPDMSLPKEIVAWDLGSGESQVLAQCWKSSKMSCAILDDLAARKCAKGAGVHILGTLGIVIKAKQTGFIPLARPILELLLRKGMYLNIDLIKSILTDVGE